MLPTIHEQMVVLRQNMIPIGRLQQEARNRANNHFNGRALDKEVVIVFKKAVVAFMISVLFAGFSMAEGTREDFTEEDLLNMAFDELSDEEKAAVVKNLQNLADESIERAEEKIREQGGLVPFAYLGDYEGEGQFAWFNHDEPVQPEVAASAIQRSVVQAAFQGNLVASVLYMTSGTPRGVDQETREEIEGQLTDEVSFDDLRFLIIEMQHLAGLGIMKVVPYWREDGEWVFGASEEQRVSPELHRLVRQTFQRQMEQHQEEQQ